MVGVKKTYGEHDDDDVDEWIDILNKQMYKFKILYMRVCVCDMQIRT